ncbi:MAG: HPF/RaiA family ribosome-associated protein [Terriglobales bacterium]
MNLHITLQVPRSPEIRHIIDRFQQKLEPLLFVFQPELVQLQGRLVRHTSREGVCCRLNLHLPTGQLSSESTASTAQHALRSASDELVRQLHRHKQRLRETRPRWHAPTHRGSFLPAPVPEAERQADLAAYFGSHYEQLLAFVRRQIALRERLDEIPRGWLDPAEVLNEVIVAALDARPSEPSLNRGRWLLLLSAAAIRNVIKSYGEMRHGQALRSLEENQSRVAAVSDDIAEKETLEDRLASPQADPEENAAAIEGLQRLVAAVKPLPRQQRNDLVLYLLEGFRPKELAQLSGRSEAEVVASLDQAETTLHQMPNPPSLLHRPMPLDGDLRLFSRPRTRARPPRSAILPQRA